MRKRKPCEWCGAPKRFGKGARTCGNCRYEDTIWRRMILGPNDCWLWTGPTYHGYGQSGGDQPHRISYRELIGEIPQGLHLDHLCRIPACCNPWHLEPVTPSENSRRKWAAYRTCKSGHDFTPENTKVRTDGTRACRQCKRDRALRAKAERVGS
jgi:hypothetical protein